MRSLLTAAVCSVIVACSPAEPGGNAGGAGTAGGGRGTAGGGSGTSGGSTSGGSTAGGSTAGGSTAGGSTAGGSTAGGSTAGGSTAGGSTAGGSTAGGSTAGGSTAGGGTAGGASTGTIGTWQLTSFIDGGITRSRALASSGRVYFFGGNGPSLSAVARVESAAIQPNGSLGAFVPTTPLPSPRSLHGLAAANGYVYVIGGTHGTIQFATGTADVECAPLLADGGIGAWFNVTPLPAPRTQVAAVGANGIIYAVGGNDGGRDTDEVDYARVNSDGTLQPWTTGSFNGTLARTAVVATTSRIYAIGGYSSGFGGNYPYVLASPFNPDGGLGAWTTGTTMTPMNPARAMHGATVAANGWVYVAGGYGGTNQTFNDTQKALVNANGTFGPWQVQTNLVNFRANTALVSYGGYLYAVGGDGQLMVGATYDTVEYAPIAP